MLTTDAQQRQGLVLELLAIRQACFIAASSAGALQLYALNAELLELGDVLGELTGLAEPEEPPPF